MNIIDWLTLAHNIPFVAAIMFATMFSVAQLFLGFMPDGIDLDVDADGDVDIDIDTDLDGHGPGFLTAVLSWVGVGKAPLTVLLLVFAQVFGLLGLTVSYLLSFVFSVPLVGTGLAWAWVFAVAVVSARITGLSARFINRLLPSDSTHATGGTGFVNRLATATTDVGPDGGQILVDDSYLFCVCKNDKPIRKGERVLIVSYDPDLFIYQVEPIQG